jgi:hypothetical protein
VAIEKAHFHFGAAVKAASAALVALLGGSAQFIMADLYTLTLVGGLILRYSPAPTALTANGYSFALGPKFERSKTKVVIGTQVDELDVKVYPETTDVIGAVPFLEAAWQGQLDGALLQLERAFMPTYGDTSPGTVILFAGRISDIDCSRTFRCRAGCGSHLAPTSLATRCVNSIERACRRRSRLDKDANRDDRQREPGEPLHPGHHRRRDWGKRWVEPHDR